MPLALRSHALWRKLEDETGERLLLQCGFMAVDSSGGAAELHGKPGFFDATVAAARRFGIAHELLGPLEARRRFPRCAVGDGDRVYYEAGGGLVFPEACIRAQLSRAQALGAAVRVGERVIGIEPDGSGVRVTTDRASIAAESVVVTAGGWTPGLIGEPLSHLRLLRQVLHWFEADDLAAFDAGRSPTFIWTHGPGPADSFYGFPYVPGLTREVKVATEQYDAAVETPEGVDRDVARAEVAAMHRDHVAGRLIGVRPVAVRSAVCFYSMARRGDFMVERHGADERVVVVSACSGHGFKHSAALGEGLAEEAWRTDTSRSGGSPLAVSHRSVLQAPGEQAVLG